jgi:hypothetical protein
VLPQQRLRLTVKLREKNGRAVSSAGSGVTPEPTLPRYAQRPLAWRAPAPKRRDRRRISSAPPARSRLSSNWPVRQPKMSIRHRGGDAPAARQLDAQRALSQEHPGHAIADHDQDAGLALDRQNKAVTHETFGSAQRRQCRLGGLPATAHHTVHAQQNSRGGTAGMSTPSW